MDAIQLVEASDGEVGVAVFWGGLGRERERAGKKKELVGFRS